jgi:hypothetical protein
MRSYYLYGVHLESVMPLPGPEITSSGQAAIELLSGPSSLFSRARREAGICAEGKEWFAHAGLSDGSDYLQWSGLFEFIVSAGGHRESFQTYLLGQVLSFALLKQGIEPLHSTTVVIDGKAVAFLGDSGYGKSSLGAAFLQEGSPLLTDDLLVLKEMGDRFVAYPGPPRIKLFPEIARRLLGDRVDGIPMNNDTSKLVIPLGPDETVSPECTFPLKAIYILRPPAKSHNSRIMIRQLSPRHAFVTLIKNTFNAVVVDPERIKRQFALASRLAANVSVKSLSYPRALQHLPTVREAVRSDLIT